MYWKAVRCLITAGPTYEPIDPVRFIGNRSSGKMGIELAYELVRQGAEVDLILGPSSVEVVPYQNLTVTKVQTAQEMYEAVAIRMKQMQIGIFAAAVADYKPSTTSSQKIKKTESSMTIELEKTIDILHTVGHDKLPNQFIVGFALETNNEIENAKKKVIKKNLDMIVLNSLQDKGAGFQHDTNKITILDRNNNIETYELKSKSEVAQDIIHYIQKIRQ